MKLHITLLLVGLSVSPTASKKKGLSLKEAQFGNRASLYDNEAPKGVAHGLCGPAGCMQFKRDGRTLHTKAQQPGERKAPSEVPESFGPAGGHVPKTEALQPGKRDAQKLSGGASRWAQNRDALQPGKREAPELVGRASRWSPTRDALRSGKRDKPKLGGRARRWSPNRAAPQPGERETQASERRENGWTPNRDALQTVNRGQVGASKLRQAGRNEPKGDALQPEKRSGQGKRGADIVALSSRYICVRLKGFCNVLTSTFNV